MLSRPPNRPASPRNDALVEPARGLVLAVEDFVRMASHGRVVCRDGEILDASTGQWTDAYLLSRVLYGAGFSAARDWIDWIYAADRRNAGAPRRPRIRCAASLRNS